MDRIQILSDWIKQTPDDPFLHFGLAMEYLSISDTDKALQKMEEVFHLFPDYLANYYQLAKLYETLSKTDDAINIYEKGIALALLQKETKTANELRSALEELTF
ncbi:MAG: tetratricopeptide repeat protein [Bacteroidota bacterium]